MRASTCGDGWQLCLWLELGLTCVGFDVANQIARAVGMVEEEDYQGLWQATGANRPWWR